MELLGRIAEEKVADDGRAQQQRHLEALEVFKIQPVQIRLHDGQFLEPREERNSNVRLLALLGLFADYVGRLARHITRHVLAHPTFFAPHKIYSRRGGIGGRVCQGAVEVGAAGQAKRDLGQAELPAERAAPLGRLMLNQHLQIGIVQLYGELGREYGLWRRGDPSVLADLVLRQRGMRPAWLGKHFAIENVGVVCVEQGGGVCVIGVG